jgi:RHS repeat-associated protein
LRALARQRLVILVLTGLLALAGLPATLAAGIEPPLASAAAAAAGDPTPSPGADAAVATTDPTGRPMLELTWSAPEVHAGVPITLSIQARDAAGQLDTREGSVLLTLPDARAQVAGAVALPAASGQTVRVPLVAGQATATIRFATAGSQIASAILEQDASLAGESARLPVREVFFAVSGPASAAHAQRQHVVIQARDEGGRPVQSYAGDVVVSADDPFALLTDLATGAQATGTLVHTFHAEDRGQLRIEVAFARSGNRSLRVHDAADPDRQASHAVSVSPDPAAGSPADSTAARGPVLLSVPASGAALAQSGTPSFTVALSTTSTHAGVPLTMTVTATNADGTTNTGYRGQVKLTATDTAFAPGTAYRYTFTAADAGVHAFTNLVFNTAGGAHTVTVTDTATSALTGTSQPATVAETVLVATFASGTVQEDTSVNLTVRAEDGSGALVSGYRGAVLLTSTWTSVSYPNWGSGVTLDGSYTFTAADGGQHVFTPKFTYAGDQTATVTDKALASRSVTTATLVVTNAPPAGYAHGAAPSGVKLADGSTVWATLEVRGRLYVRRNVGTMAEPAWRPPVLARDTTQNNTLGADSPSLVQFGSTIALFHRYTAGTYDQVWVTTSTDNGASWSPPVPLTHERGHVGRIQAVVDGQTLYLFWSRQDTNQDLVYQTTTDLVNWTPKATVGQPIGVLVSNTTSHFGITKLAAGSWVLGWLGTSPNEAALGAANNLGYPTVHVATSTDLATWSSAVELNLPWGQRWPESVALAQDPDTQLLYAAFEQYDAPGTPNIVTRTSTDGVSWTAQTLVGYDRSAPADGRQGYYAELPTLVPGSMLLNFGIHTGNGSVQAYASPGYNHPGSCMGTTPMDPADPGQEPMLAPCGADPPTVASPTAPCCAVGQPVNAITGYQWTSAVDLQLPTRGAPLVVARTYTSYDGVMAHDGPFGIGWTWSYGVRALTHADGSVAIVEANGRRAMFWKSGPTWTPEPYVFDTLAAAGGGGYTLTRHDQSVWTFAADGRLVAIAERNGTTQTLTYTGGTLSAIAGAGGRTLTVTTDASGRITRIDGPSSLYASYTYDTGGHLLTAREAGGATTTYTYDSRHQLLTVVDGNNHTVESNTYGSLGRVREQRDAANGRWTFAPAAQGYAGTVASASTVTDPLGNVTSYLNDAALRLTRIMVRQGTGSVLQNQYFTYDSQSNLRATQVGFTYSPLTTATYDSRGNVLSTTVDSGPGKLNLTTTFTYTSTNDLLTVTDPLNHTTTFTYDAAGNLLTVTNALNQTTTFGYNGFGQLTSVTNALSQVTNFGYNSSGDLTTITEPGGIVTTLGYDAAGRLTSLTDPLSHTTTLAANGRGQVTSITNALNQTTTFGYDTIGNRTSVTDALNRTTTYAYDALNRLTTVTNALTPAGVTSYTYDANSNLTRVTDANNHVTNYTYDALGWVLTVKDALNNTTTYTYDERSNLIQTLDANNVKNRYTYDKANRLTGIDLAYTSGTPVHDSAYAYDHASRRTSLTDATGTTSYTYDNADRLLTVTAPVTGTVTYTYDALGRRASLKYPGQTNPVTYAYTTRGQLDTVTDWLSTVTDYGYDTAGRLTSIAYPNGVTSTLGYDNANRLTSITHANGAGTLESISYVLNAAGMRESMTDGSGQTTWGYDALDRLTSASYPNGDAVSYGYDAVGNRTSLTINGNTTTNTFDAADRLTASGTTTYGYDANGNQTSTTVGGVTTTYSYDSLNRLTSVTSGGSTLASYSYNGDGLRTSKTVSGVTTQFTWDPTGLGTVISDGDSYVWGLGLVGRITAGGTRTYAHQDGLGSTRLITDSSGAVVGTTAYDAFGSTRSSTGIQYRFGYTGEQLDAETGFVYLRARYMAPGSGRILSKDPFGDFLDQPTSLHRTAMWPTTRSPGLIRAGCAHRMAAVTTTRSVIPVWTSSSPHRRRWLTRTRPCR